MWRGHSGRVVFLAQHEDWNNSDWVVHESAGAPGDARLADLLGEVACDLGG